MAERYNYRKRKDGLWVVHNVRTGNIVSKPLGREQLASEIAQSLTESQLRLADKRSSGLLASGVEADLREAMEAKVYLVNGSEASAWECFREEPEDAYENWAAFSSPQATGVYTIASLALKMGIEGVLRDLREGEFAQNPETGEDWLPGTNPLDQVYWVDEKDRPYDPSCPLTRLFHTDDSTFNKELLDRPCGRPSYAVYLTDGKDQGYEACVVVQEVRLDNTNFDY